MTRYRFTPAFLPELASADYDMILDRTEGFLGVLA